ncbi:MAG: DUF4912 domain-containing protein [Blastocatellia bacterium]
MPFFFDLSSLVPVVERNPFEPMVVPDEVPIDLSAAAEEIPAEPIVDTGLPIPSHYDFDMMRALVQDPFRLFVYWQLKDNPFDRLGRIFPKAAGDFHTVLKLIDETNNIAVFFQAAFTREYWFQVFPDRTYRVELGVRSPQQGYIRLLSSQPVRMPRGGPSDQIAEEPAYHIGADDYLRVLRDSHLVPERAFTLDGLLPAHGAAPAGARNEAWEALPASFRRLMLAMADVQAGREYDRWWERLSREELSTLVQEFLGIIREMGDGEVGYMLLLRYLPELLRRSIQSEREIGGEEIQIDKPIALYLAERLGQTGSSEQNAPGGPEEQPSQPAVSPGEISHGGPGLRIPSMSL